MVVSRATVAFLQQTEENVALLSSQREASKNLNRRHPVSPVRLRVRVPRQGDGGTAGPSAPSTRGTSAPSTRGPSAPKPTVECREPVAGAFVKEDVAQSSGHDAAPTPENHKSVSEAAASTPEVHKSVSEAPTSSDAPTSDVDPSIIFRDTSEKDSSIVDVDNPCRLLTAHALGSWARRFDETAHVTDADVVAQAAENSPVEDGDILDVQAWLHRKVRGFDSRLRAVEVSTAVAADVASNAAATAASASKPQAAVSDARIGSKSIWGHPDEFMKRLQQQLDRLDSHLLERENRWREQLSDAVEHRSRALLGDLLQGPVSEYIELRLGEMKASIRDTTSELQTNLVSKLEEMVQNLILNGQIQPDRMSNRSEVSAAEMGGVERARAVEQRVEQRIRSIEHDINGIAGKSDEEIE